MTVSESEFLLEVKNLDIEYRQIGAVNKADMQSAEMAIRVHLGMAK